MDLLPSTTYQQPPRRAGRRHLNTIAEEPELTSRGSAKSDSETDGSDSTITGRPAAFNSKLFVAGPARKQSRLGNLMTAVSPASTIPSPASSLGSGFERNSVQGSIAGSENGTIFSDDTCPSLTSDPTTFATDSNRHSLLSSRSSIGSNKSARNRYPALLIPRSSWDMTDSPLKELALGMSPGSKFNLSPAMLARLPVPSVEASTPSLGGSSLASESPCIPSVSGPGTPDLHNIDVGEGEGWGQPSMTHTLNPLEIALDDDQSIILSPADAHSDVGPPSASVPPLNALLSPREAEWGGMVSRFPGVPNDDAGATSFPLGLLFLNKASQPSENGILLPNDALATLNRLTREVSPDEKSEISRFREMRERTGMSPTALRPNSWDDATPATEASFSKLSDYSYTQLSIPSPGGFFSSLQGGARHTWCLDKRGSRQSSVPSSAAAENFYFNWDNLHTKSTVLTVDDSDATDGPPTARQNSFDSGVTGLESRDSTSSKETDDLYGVGAKAAAFPSPGTVQYEQAYDEELKQASEVNLDRTSSWLSAQTSYLSSLRESNPLNSPADYLPSPHPGLQEDPLERSNTIDSNIRKTVRFLEEARSATVAHPPPNPLTTALTPTVTSPKSGQTSPDSATSPSNSTKESIFHSAFTHLLSTNANPQTRSMDTLLHASARLESTRSLRIALPDKHIDSLLGQHWLAPALRPKYSGPFNGNPRATGIFDRSVDALMYESVEREQTALRTMESGTWDVDALRSLYSGRLLASSNVCDKLSTKSTLPLNDPACVGAKRLRILDFGGTAAGSWGWHAASQWPNVKVYTVITKEQSIAQRPAGVPKAQGPENHRVVSVPHLWQLPFKSNHFDVVSARGLHALLRAEPVPGVKEIDEWDLALRECKRILKPGGTLDFLVMDAGLAKPGTLGEKMSVEFGYELKKRGYERDAAGKMVGKVMRQGFKNVKRAWMFLPCGNKDEGGSEGEWLPAPRPVSEVSTISKIVRQYEHCEAVQGPVGSGEKTADVAALLAGRMWEEWIVKVRMEQGRERARLLEGIDEVLQEGKEEGSGWRVLVGWCVKPRVKLHKGERPKSGRAEIKVLLGDDDATPMPTPMTAIFINTQPQSPAQSQSQARDSSKLKSKDGDGEGEGEFVSMQGIQLEMKERPGHESLLSQATSRRSGEMGIVPFMIQASPRL